MSLPKNVLHSSSMPALLCLPLLSPCPPRRPRDEGRCPPPAAAPQAALPAPGATSPDLKCTLAVCNTGVSVSTPNAELICHLPFEARAKMCCAIFCATESAQKTLVQRGGSNLDGFALDKE